MNKLSRWFKHSRFTALRKYSFEFVSIFIAVISAFALNNWNDARKTREAEAKILQEIANGLEKDLQDIQGNMMGHEAGLYACHRWMAAALGDTVAIDSLFFNFLNLTRDFIVLQNVSGYETLKSRGLELISNDSLRMQIIDLYEYNYKTLEKLEEKYAEMQYQQQYYASISALVTPYFIISPEGHIIGIQLPLKLSANDQKALVTMLTKIKVNRQYTLFSYRQVQQKVAALQTNIASELARLR